MGQQSVSNVHLVNVLQIEFSIQISGNFLCGLKDSRAVVQAVIVSLKVGDLVNGSQTVAQATEEILLLLWFLVLMHLKDLQCNLTTAYNANQKIVSYYSLTIFL